MPIPRRRRWPRQHPPAQMQPLAPPTERTDPSIENAQRCVTAVVRQLERLAARTSRMDIGGRPSRRSSVGSTAGESPPRLGGESPAGGATGDGREADDAAEFGQRLPASLVTGQYRSGCGGECRGYGGARRAVPMTTLRAGGGGDKQDRR